MVIKDLNLYAAMLITRYEPAEALLPLCSVLLPACLHHLEPDVVPCISTFSFDVQVDQILDAEHGELASGLVGKGRMAEPEHNRVAQHQRSGRADFNKRWILSRICLVVVAIHKAY